MKLKDFAVGDNIQITITMKTRTTVGDAEVTAVTAINYKGNALVTFSGRETGQGAFDPEKVGTKPFGITKVEKLGGKGPQYCWQKSRWYPRPGDRGYDLMC